MMSALVTIMCWLWQNWPFIEGVTKKLGSFEAMPKVVEVSPTGTEDDGHISELLELPKIPPHEEFWLIKVELLGNSCPLVMASRILPIWSGDTDNWVLCPRPSAWKFSSVAFSVKLLRYSVCCWIEVGPSSNGGEEWVEKGIELGSLENELGWPCHRLEHSASVKKNEIDTNL